jgi:predicted aspartyl protease
MEKAVALILMRVAMICVLVSGAPGCGDPTAKSHAGPIEIPLQDYQGVLVTVPTQAGGTNLPFILDTAGGLTVITPELAHRIGLSTFGRVSGFRMSGERLDFPRCERTLLEVGPLSVETDPVVFDLMQLLPEGWPELGGIVSLHTLQDHVVTLDLASSKLIIESESSLEKRLKGMREMNARFARQASGMSLDVFVEVAAERGNLWMELDTGNAGPTILPPHALEQLGIDEAKGTDEWSGILPLSFPGIGVIEVDCTKQELIYDGVLNLRTIKKMTLTLDMPNERLWAAIRSSDGPNLDGT